MTEILHFYHINDLHSQFDHWPRIQNLLHERKNLHSQVGEEMLILDLGDHADRAHPFTEATLGSGNVELLNEVGCQYATIGNNEGITFPFDTLDHLYDHARFDVLVCNLFYRNGERPEWALPYKIHTTRQGTKIGLLGATANFRVFYNSLGWKVTEPIEEIGKIISEIKEQCDVIIVLSHLGIDADEKMAVEIPGIDLILGAHTHHILHEGKLVNESLLCGAGKGGVYVGHVEMTIGQDRAPLEKKARLYDMNQEQALPNEERFRMELHEAGKKGMGDIICTLDRDIGTEWFQPSELPQLLCDELMAYSDADCSFLNSGLLLDSLKAGDVSRYDLHRICPHPINPCVIELSGSELKEILLQSMDKEWPHKQIKGFGFRGDILGIMVYSNIQFKSNHEILVGNEKVNRHAKYKLAIPDMFTFGYFFPQIKRSEKKQYLLPEFLRDLLASKLSDCFGRK